MSLPKSIYTGGGLRNGFRSAERWNNNRKMTSGRKLQAVTGHYDKDGNWIAHKSIKFIKHN